MKKRICYILTTVIFVVIFTACTPATIEAENEEPLMVSEYIDLSNHSTNFIYTDTETGVEYLVVRTGNGACITPLYNADGSLKLNKRYK